MNEAGYVKANKVHRKTITGKNGAAPFVRQQRSLAIGEWQRRAVSSFAPSSVATECAPTCHLPRIYWTRQRSNQRLAATPTLRRHDRSEGPCWVEAVNLMCHERAFTMSLANDRSCNTKLSHCIMFFSYQSDQYHAFLVTPTLSTTSSPTVVCHSTIIHAAYQHT